MHAGAGIMLQSRGLVVASILARKSLLFYHAAPLSVRTQCRCLVVPRVQIPWSVLPGM